MDELLKSVLAEAYEAEFEEYNNPPYHFFSLKHRKKMKQLFKEGRNAEKRTVVVKSARKRTMVLVMAIILSVLLSIAVAAAIFSAFGFTKHSDNTIAFSTNYENSPETIEYIYVLDKLPKGFELKENLTSTVGAKINYISESDYIYFTQTTKSKYRPHYNTERYAIEKTDINGHEGFCVEFEKNTLVVWDNGDYILEMQSTLSKDELISLAQNLKKQELTA